MKSLIQELLSAAPVVTDGAWGTELQARGLEPGGCPDAWNLAHPDRVEEVARAYVEAGSEIILTNTFCANRLALARYNLAEKLLEINRAGVAISRRAARGSARVFASMGPSGKLLAMGEVSEGEVRLAFDEQAKALAEAGADGIVIETMSDLAEAKLALAAARATGLPVVASMTFDSGRGHDRTMMGTTPEEAATELSAAGADVIGANCGQGVEGYVEVCRRLHAATNLPVWIKPNAGLPEISDGRVRYRQTPQSFAGHARALVEAGASFIGGCCGTTPDFIQELSARLKTVRAPRRPPMRLRLISCEIFCREFCALVANSPHTIDVEFLPKGLHDVGTDAMRERLQSALDRIDNSPYDAILLGYGLCNNGTTGLTARLKPLVIPRAHDCITLFLGSASRYSDYFQNHPGVFFKTTGWIERGGVDGELSQLALGKKLGFLQTFEEMVARYGEDNARFLQEQLGDLTRHYRKFTFIEMGVEPDSRFEELTRQDAKGRGWAFEKVKGDLGMLRRFVNGQWDEKEFLIVPPGFQIVAKYDEGIVDVQPADS